MRSQAGKHTIGPTIKLQHRNMLEKTSQHTYYTVSAEDSNGVSRIFFGCSETPPPPPPQKDSGFAGPS